MTSDERVMITLSGGIPDRVPTDLHNFMMASRMAGIPLSECLKSGELMAQSHLVAWRYFGHDMVLVESGTTAMAQAMGCGVVYTDEAASRIVDPVLKSLDDVDKLVIPDPEKDYPLNEVIKAVNILSMEIGSEVCIMGRADQAPLALAAAIRGHEQLLLDLGMCEDPAIIQKLLNVCVEATSRYALALKRAGAHCTSIGELGSDSISPKMYRQYCMPNLQAFFRKMSECDFPGAVHQCGNTDAVLVEMSSCGAKIIELDPKTDMRAAKEAAQGKAVILGMVDPANVLHRGTPELVLEKSREALEILAPGGGFILGPGCALVPETPEDNVMALIESAKRYGVYNPDGTLSP